MRAGWIIKMSTSHHRKINDHMTETGRRHSWIPLSSSPPHSQYWNDLRSRKEEITERPLSVICWSVTTTGMKGTGWCGECTAHDEDEAMMYEVYNKRSPATKEKWWQAHEGSLVSLHCPNLTPWMTPNKQVSQFQFHPVRPTDDTSVKGMSMTAEECICRSTCQRWRCMRVARIARMMSWKLHCGGGLLVGMCSIVWGTYSWNMALYAYWAREKSMARSWGWAVESVLTRRNRDVNTFTIEKTFGIIMIISEHSDDKIACGMTYIDRIHNRICYASAGHHTEGYELFASSV